MLIEMIDQYFEGDYDFFYLPIDYKVLINLTRTSVIWVTHS